MNFLLLSQSPQLVVLKIFFPKGLHCDSNFLSNPQTPLPLPTQEESHNVRMGRNTPSSYIVYRSENQGPKGSRGSGKVTTQLWDEKRGQPDPLAQAGALSQMHRPHRPSWKSLLLVLSWWWNPDAQPEFQMSS